MAVSKDSTAGSKGSRGALSLGAIAKLKTKAREAREETGILKKARLINEFLKQ